MGQDAEPPADKPRGPDPRGPRRPPRNKPPPTPLVRAQRALTELERALDEIAALEGAPRPRELPLQITLGRRAEHAAGTVEAIRQRVAALSPSAHVWRAGSVQCYQCETADCHHTRPPGPDHVFTGYQPTGKPAWRPFVEVCLQRGEPGLDQLYESPPGVVAFAQGAELTAQLLPGFGDGDVPWQVRGQVVVGLVFASRTALTVQVVQLRQPGAPTTLRLNLIGADLFEIEAAAAEGAARGTAERLRRTLQQVRRKLGGVGRRAVAAEAQGQAFELDEAIAPLLHQLRGDLARVFSPEQRRTGHAQHRHQSGERPTSQAFRDAQEAGVERLFADTRRDTVVVVGGRGRAHVFTKDGRHVTSLRLEDGELNRKQARRRWRPLSDAEAQAFRVGLGSG